MPRRFVFVVALVMSILIPSIASASIVAGAENRILGIDLVVPALAWASSSARAEHHEGNDGLRSDAPSCATLAAGETGAGAFGYSRAPWVTDLEATNLRLGTVTEQCAGGSCLSKAGEIVTDGAASEANTLAKIGEWAEPADLAKELNASGGADVWDGAWTNPRSSVALASNGGKTVVVVKTLDFDAHAVVIEPLPTGGFEVTDPGIGATYDVTASWVRRYVVGGVWRR